MNINNSEKAKKYKFSTLYAWPFRDADPIIKPCDFWHNPANGRLHPVYKRSDCTTFFLAPIKSPKFKTLSISHESVTETWDTSDSLMEDVSSDPGYSQKYHDGSVQQPPETQCIGNNNSGDINPTMDIAIENSALMYTTSIFNVMSMKLPVPVTVTNQEVDFVMCAFCRSNGESPATYQSHSLMAKGRKVNCPVLRKFICPNCGATGDDAHTLKYCPLRSVQDQLWDKNMFPRLVRSSIGKVKVCRY